MPPNVEWKTPALLWEPQSRVEAQPRLLELHSDEFVPEFLTAMGQPAEKQNGQTIVPAANYMKAKVWRGTQNPPRLYLPLHQRYYLVTGSLICKVVGMPDKLPDAKAGEKVGFVVRRLRNNNAAQEQSFVDGDGWKDSLPRSDGLLPNEERFPLHAVKVCTGRGGTQCERHIFYGYVATGAREKYLEKADVGNENDSPEEKLKALHDGIKNDTSIGTGLSEEKKKKLIATEKRDYRLTEFDTRVVDSVAASPKVPAPDPKAPDKDKANFYALLELGDFLRRALPDVWAEIGRLPNDATTSNMSPDTFKNLVNHLITKGLAFPLRDNAGYLGLVHGEGSEPSSFAVVDVKTNIVGIEDILTAALNAEMRPMLPLTEEVGENIADILSMVKNELPDTAPGAHRYIIRLFYEYDPECPAIVSANSLPFVFARPMEPDAPARMVRIEMPSINQIDLRKFKHGVGIQMSKELRKVMSGVTPGILKGDGLQETTEFDLQMICTFSIQIITIIAMILMMVMAILLNIIFMWLPFLKVCLPIPKPKANTP